MKSRIQLLAVTATTVLLLAIIGVWLSPNLIAALPTRYKLYLPDAVIELVTTPLPTALPTAAVAAVPIQLTIPVIPSVTPTASATATATPITVATAVIPQTTIPTPTPKPSLTPTASPEPPPPAARINNLEIIPQKFNNCGPANLTIALNYYGHPSDQLDIAAIVKPNYDDRNVSPWELRDYVNEHTPLQATVHSGGNLTLLKQLIATNTPVIIEKGLLPNAHEGWMGHYLTLFGYDDAEQQFYSHDTFLGPWDSSGRSDSYDTLERYWRHFNYTFILIYPSNRAKTIQRILGPTMQEPLQMWQVAANRAQTDIEADPQNAFAWFNLGTSLTHLGALTEDPAFYDSATAAFDQSRQIGLPPRMLWYQFQPLEAYLATGRINDVIALTDATLISSGGQTIEEAHLYRGHALLANGDEAAARTAYNRALDLHPNFPPTLAALDHINN